MHDDSAMMHGACRYGVRGFDTKDAKPIVLTKDRVEGIHLNGAAQHDVLVVSCYSLHAYLHGDNAVQHSTVQWAAVQCGFHGVNACESHLVWRSTHLVHITSVFMIMTLLLTQMEHRPLPLRWHNAGHKQ
jgi:hypothetical protein